MKKVIFLLLLFFSLTVKGLEKEYVDTEYIEIYFNGIVNNVLISNKAVYMEHQGIPLYCLDFSIPISRDIGYDVYNFNDIDQYTNDQKTYIELISYFGYKYRNQTDIYYYLAAQELIWGSLGHDTYWTYTRYGGDIIDLTAYKMEILNLYSEYINENFLYNEYYTMNIGNSYEYYDSSNILPQYEYEYNGNNNISFTPREITFYATNSGVETLKLIRNYDKGFESKIFVESNYQTILKPGSITNKEKILNFVIFNTDIYLKRIDETTISNNSTSLKYALFELYDSNNNVIKSVLSNDNGEVIFPDMPFGTYTIKEIIPSYGYEKNDEIINVDLFFGNSPIYIDVTAKRLKKELTITNIYKENDIEYFDEGIIFEIYKDDILFETLATNNNGNARTYLEYGNYSIKQTSGREGFEIEPIIYFEVNEFDNNLNHLFYKELITEKETVIEEIVDDPIIIENIEEEPVDDDEENPKPITEILDEESLVVEYDDSNAILIDELPQLFDEKYIYISICEKLLLCYLSYLYYLY